MQNEWRPYPKLQVAQMVWLGLVKNGVVVWDSSSPPPEGARVKVEILDSQTIPTLAERLAPIIGSCPGLPEDFAENHDHYLHGQPKK